jgi:hypothetical protein
VQINDVNALLLSEDVRGHVGVPLALEVTEMDTGLEQMLEINFRHCLRSFKSNLSVAWLDQGPRRLDAKRFDIKKEKV